VTSQTMSGLWHHKMPSIFHENKRCQKVSFLACQILFAHLQKWRCRFRHIDEILSANLHMAHRNGGVKKYRGFYALSWYGLQRGEPPGVGSKKIPRTTWCGVKKNPPEKCPHKCVHLFFTFLVPLDPPKCQMLTRFYIGFFEKSSVIPLGKISWERLGVTPELGESYEMTKPTVRGNE